jgi:hypothetical protein
MTDNIIKFPGFIVLEDRNTIAKDGMTYKNTKALIADLNQDDLRRTFEWQCRRASYGNPPWVTARLDNRARMMGIALHGDAPLQQGGAA